MVVQAHRTLSNLFEPHHYRDSKVCRVLSHEFSGWFDCTEPSLSTSLQVQQGMQGVVHLLGVHRISSNLLEPHHYKDSKVCRVLSHEFWVVRLYRTFSIYIVYRGNKVCRVLMHLFGVVQAHRTSSNLFKPHHYGDSKVCRGLSHEFGVVRLYRTFSIYIVYRGNKVCRVLMHLFGVVKAHQTYSNLLEPHHYRDSKVCRVLS